MKAGAPAPSGRLRARGGGDTRERAPQRGAVLVVALLLLVVLTLLGTESMRIANFDMALATNTQLRVRALAEAEGAVVEAERFIQTNFPGVPNFDWSQDEDDGLYMPGELSTPAVNGVDWGSSQGGYQTAAGGGSYTIEYLGGFANAGSSLGTGTGATPAEMSYLYLITARGTAASGSVRFVQTVYEVAM